MSGVVDCSFRLICMTMLKLIIFSFILVVFLSQSCFLYFSMINILLTV